MKQRKLNNDQLIVLHALYRFRFGTRSLIAEFLGKPNNTSLYSRITILEKYGLIAKRYNSEYKINRREAEFYITYKGALVLRDAGIAELSDTALQATYKDRVVSESYISEIILLFRIRNLLVTSYPDLQYFTIRDIQPLGYFPKNRPSGFIAYKHDGSMHRFFVEYIPAGTAISTIRGKLKHYSSYFQQDTWGATNTSFPRILYICEDGLTEQGVRYHMKRELYRADTDIEYFTTTKKAILNLVTNDKMWTSVDDTDNVLDLNAL